MRALLLLLGIAAHTSASSIECLQPCLEKSRGCTPSEEAWDKAECKCVRACSKEQRMEDSRLSCSSDEVAHVDSRLEAECDGFGGQDVGDALTHCGAGCWKTCNMSPDTDGKTPWTQAECDCVENHCPGNWKRCIEEPSIIEVVEKLLFASCKGGGCACTEDPTVVPEEDPCCGYPHELCIGADACDAEKCCFVPDQETRCISKDDGTLKGCPEGVGPLPVEEPELDLSAVCSSAVDYTADAAARFFRGSSMTCDEAVEIALVDTLKKKRAKGSLVEEFESLMTGFDCGAPANKPLVKAAVPCCGTGNTMCGDTAEPTIAVAECMCTREWAPVCGTVEGRTKTFSNTCEAGCSEATDLVQGECQDDASNCYCTKEYMPVCGTLPSGATETFSNKCVSKCNGAVSGTQGACKEKVVLSTDAQTCKDQEDAKGCKAAGTDESFCCGWQKGRCFLEEDGCPEVSIADDNECKSGYAWDEKYFACVDDDECLRPKESCGTATVCKNTIGGYSCECKKGAVRNDDFVCEFLRVIPIVKARATTALSGVSKDDFGQKEATVFKKATVKSLGGVVKSEDDVTIVSVEDVSVSGRRRLNEQTALEIDYDLAVAVEDEDASEDGTFADLQTAMAASEAGFAEALEEESTAEGSSAFDGTTATTTAPDSYETVEVVDVDECSSETHNCDANALCTDTVDGFTCVCNQGFAASGGSGVAGTCLADSAGGEEDSVAPAEEEEQEDGSSRGPLLMVVAIVALMG